MAWTFNAPQYTTATDIQNMICPENNKPALWQIMPIYSNAPKLVYYDNCAANLYAALRRQCTATPAPDKEFLIDFTDFFNTVIMGEITHILQDFDYSFNVWFNHLTANQQNAIDQLDTDKLDVRYTKMFCKAEKQMIEGGVMPKNRAISAMCEEHKYVMGPVVYALEQYFKQLKGYGGGKTWDDTANLINYWDHSGLTKVIQSDISGMDRSVTQEIKEIIQHTVYRHIEHKIKHVDLEVWQKHAYPVNTIIKADYYEDKELKSFGQTTMRGEVFSGSADTTFLNTLITLSFQRYVMERVLALDEEEFGIVAKGDDSVVTVQPNIDNTHIRKGFSKVYYDAANIKPYYSPYYLQHGCGMVLKFLSISEHLDDIDYCSTNTFKCHTCNSYKVTRKIDRFIYLTPWTDSIMNMKHEQQLAYMHNLYLSNLRWMDGLSIFSTLNNFLKTDVISDYSLSGKPRRIIPLAPEEAAWYLKMFNPDKDADTYKLQRAFGKNAAYSMINQKNELKPCCIKDYQKWLEHKLGINQFNTETIETDMKSHTNGIYHSPTLETALHHYDLYRESLLSS
jgi:hypothetical protein